MGLRAARLEASRGLRLAARGSQLVPDAAYRADERLSAERAELPPQVRDVDVDDVGAPVRRVIGVPDVPRELLARDRMAGVARQVLEKIGLAPRQRDLDAVAA